MAVVDELVTVLGINLKQDLIGKINDFKAKLNEATRAATKLGAAVSLAATGAGLLIRRTLTKVNELRKLSEATKISTTALQEWEYAAEKSGVEAKAITSDLANLQKTMASPIPGEFNATLAMFGVRVRNANGELKTADQLLLGMSAKFEKMSEQRAAQWAAKLGISGDTLLLLRKGKDGIEELRKEAHKLGGIIPAESIRVAAEFRRQLSELQFAMKGLGHQAAIATLPALSKTVGKLKEFIGSSKEWISVGLESVMGGLASALERAWGMLQKFGGMFEPLIGHVEKILPGMEGVELVTQLVTGALAVLLVYLSPLLIKFAAVAAVVTLLSAVFEDFFTFLEGGESIIGDLFDAFKERWPELYGAIQKAGTFIKETFVDGLKFAWGIIETFGAKAAEIAVYVTDRLNALVVPVLEFISTFKTEFPAVTQILSKFVGFIKGVFISVLHEVVEIIKHIAGLIFDVAKTVGSVVKGALRGAEWGLGKLGFGQGEKKQGRAQRPSSEDAEARAGLRGRRTPFSSRLKQEAPSGGEKGQGAEEPWEMDLGHIFSKQGLDVSVFQKQQMPSRSNVTNVNNTDSRNININIATNDPVSAGRQVGNVVSSSPLNTNAPGQFSPVAY